MAVLSAAQAAEQYKVPSSNPGAEFAKNAYKGPDSPAGYQKGNRQSNTFVFRSKHLNPDRPNSYSAESKSDIYGGDSQPGMGA